MISKKGQSIFKSFLFCLFIVLIACNKEDDSPAVPNCNDGIQNQDETGVDCGGVCRICPTCDDGIRNQGELGIDCSGPCPIPCPFVPPCNYADNTSLQDHNYTTMTCDESAGTIMGVGVQGEIKITFNTFPTENSVFNIGGGNSITIEDNPLNDTFNGTSGKLYVQFTGTTFRVTFCDLLFSSSTIGSFRASGRVVCN